MWVVTADQIASRSNGDRVPEALEALAQVPTLLPFERTTGDELQGVPRDAASALDAVLILSRLGDWSVGLGLGSAVLATSSTESSGEAFIRAREAVERARKKSSPFPVALDLGGAGEGIEPLVRLLAHLVADRSPATWSVLDELATAESGRDAAQRLGMTPQNVSRARRGALWDVEREARTSIADLLTAAAADVGAS